jgi:F0F1-type ATP synthase assembly protein I
MPSNTQGKAILRGSMLGTLLGIGAALCVVAIENFSKWRPVAADWEIDALIGGVAGFITAFILCLQSMNHGQLEIEE